MANDLEDIKQQIIMALSDSEAEDGLYLNNLQNVHEEETRAAVLGSQLEILEALKELIREGRVFADDSGEDVIFCLKQ